MKHVCCFLLFVTAFSAMAKNADEAWAAIENLRKGPGVPPADAPEEVVRTARAHLARQEQALEAFLTAYPSDPRRHEAAIELAGVTAALGASLSDRNRVERSIRSLAAVERDKTASSTTRADAAFQRITTTMQTVVLAGQSRADEIAGARNLVYDSAGNFAARYPEDRRAARLLAEAATLFNDMPERKRKILEQASIVARDEGTRKRIADDLKRLDLLGRPGDVSFDTIQGGRFSLADNRGKVAVLIFWAGWSPPSVAWLAGLAREVSAWPQGRVVVATVSLDEKKGNCSETLRVLGIGQWPTACSGRGWQDPVARALAINALPTVFVYDAEGTLRTLNAREDGDALVRKLAAEETSQPR
ncbi:MAG: TlpA family protein disulfide reductase [Chthoniobacterales bacterium]|nr:TlpA family protein disulfide reductase [Chthoniobacterales bacterium]